MSQTTEKAMEDGRAGSPGAAGPDPAPMIARLDKIVSTRAGSPFGLPGAVFAVATRDGAVTVVAKGEDALGRPIKERALFPLASASKLATGLVILSLIDAGVLLLDAAIGAYLPEAAAARTDGVTIRRLLCHTSGLPLEVPHELSSPPGNLKWNEELRWPGALADACLAAGADRPPASAVQYSNVAYGLLALAAERVTGSPFADLLRRTVSQPLGIEAYLGDIGDRETIAVSDIPSPFAGTSLEPYNSRMALRVGAPWVSLVTDARGLLALVRAYAEGGALLSDEMSREAGRDQTGGLSGGFGTTEAFLGHGPSRSIIWSPCPWGLAVEVQGGKEPHWAPPALPNSFGQIGSSGCLAWFDRDSGVAWAAMGARTTESGWLLRHGARLAQAALAAAGAAA